MGKLGYMSPEQAQAKTVDYRSDLFSAGIVIWELLTGRALYQGGTMGEMVAQMAFPNVPSPRTLRPEISDTLEQIVMGSLQTDPNDRYARGDDFARALNELAVREGLTVGAEEVGNYVRAMCPEEFAAERKLQSQLSIMRKKASAPEQATAEIEGTFLRPSSPKLATDQVAQHQPDLTPAQRALSVNAQPTPAAPKAKSKAPIPSPDQAQVRTQARRQAQASSAAAEETVSEPVVVPRSKAPLIGVAVVVLAVIGGGAFFALRSKDEPAPVVVPPVVEKPVEKQPDPVAVEKPVEKPEATPGPIEAVAEKAEVLGMVATTGDDLAIRIDDDGKVIIIVPEGHKTVFAEGDDVLLIGPPDADKKAPIYAKAIVDDIKGRLVKLEIEKGNKAAARFAQRQVSSVKVPRKPKKPVEVAAVDKTPVRQPVVDKTPTVQPVEKPVTEKPVQPAMVPEAFPKTGPTQQQQVVAPAQVAIKGELTVFRRTQRMVIQNRTGVTLTNCTVRLTNNHTATLASIGASVELLASSFKLDPRGVDPALKAYFDRGYSAVYCTEGTGGFYTAYR
jgi:hypothetical protein